MHRKFVDKRGKNRYNKKVEKNVIFLEKKIDKPLEIW